MARATTGRYNADNEKNADYRSTRRYISSQDGSSYNKTYRAGGLTLQDRAEGFHKDTPLFPPEGHFPPLSSFLGLNSISPPNFFLRRIILRFGAFLYAEIVIYRKNGPIFHRSVLAKNIARLLRGTFERIDGIERPAAESGARSTHRYNLIQTRRLGTV